MQNIIYLPTLKRADGIATIDDLPVTRLVEAPKHFKRMDGSLMAAEMYSIFQRRAKVVYETDLAHQKKDTGALAAPPESEPIIRGAIALLPSVFREHALDKLSQRNFIGYLWLFDSEERLQGFLAIEPLLRDDEYWRCLRMVWIMTELTLKNKSLWVGLLKSTRTNSYLLMTNNEREQLSAMPPMLDVHRGFSHMGGKNGLSWTLDVEEARFFACYASSPRRRYFGADRCDGAFVVSGRCRKTDVIAYLTGRDETDIIIPGSEVFSKTVISVA